MPIPVQTFSQQQIPQMQPNPWLTGMKSGLGISSEMNEQMYQPRMLQEELRKMQLANQMAQAQADYAPDMAKQQLIRQQLTNSILGPQAENAPEMANQELLKARLQNIMQQAAADYAPQTAELGYKKALQGYQNPLLGQNGTAGQYGAALYLKQHPELNFSAGNGPVASPQPAANGMMNGASPQPLPLTNQQRNNVAQNVSSAAPGSQLTINPLDILKPSGNPNLPSSMNMGDQLLNMIQQQNDAKMAHARWDQRRTEGYTYAQMPADVKQYAIAQTNALGYDPTEATRLMSEDGKSIADLAEMKGYGRDPKDRPMPQYVPGAPARAIQQKRDMAYAELEELQHFTTKAFAPYAQRFNGWSPKQIMDAMSGDNKQKQIDFWSAKMLSPEIDALKVKTLQGDVGIEAMKHVGEEASNHFKAFESQLTPEIYEEANKQATRKIGKAIDAANRAIQRPLQKRDSNDTDNTASKYSDEDIAHTAERRGMTVDQVKKLLEARQ